MANEKKSGGLLEEAAEMFNGFSGIVNGDVFDPSYWKGPATPEVKPEVKETKRNDDDTEVIEEEHRVRRGKRGTFVAAPKVEREKPADKPADKPAE